MIRGLGHHLKARTQQLGFFHAHLRAQYLDRIQYWEHRGLARLQTNVVSIICDGMDQSKWDLPRSRVLRGKEFGTMLKAKLHMTACIAHGHCVMVAVSAPDTKKDGNSSVELLAHMVSFLQNKGLRLSQMHLHLQHDNTCREFKNHTGLTWCASQISAKNFASVIRAGHTHEDIDQLFSRMSKFLHKVPVLQTPNDVCSTIKAFLEQTCSEEGPCL